MGYLFLCATAALDFVCVCGCLCDFVFSGRQDQAIVHFGKLETCEALGEEAEGG